MTESTQRLPMKTKSRFRRVGLIVVLALVSIASLLSPVTAGPISAEAIFDGICAGHSTEDRQDALEATEAAARLAAIQKINDKLKNEVGSPDIATAPAPNRPQFVGLPTWLAINESASEASKSITEQGTARGCGGNVKVNMTAAPTGALWTFSDSVEEIHCTFDQMQIYVPELTGEPECARSWTETTKEDPVTVTVSIQYTMSWSSCVNEGSGGCRSLSAKSEPVLETGRATSTELYIGEVGAIGSRPDAPEQFPLPDGYARLGSGAKCNYGIFNGICGFIVGVADVMKSIVSALGDAFLGAMKLIWNFAQGCAKAGFTIVESLPAAVKAFAGFLADPGGKIGEIVDLFVNMYNGIKEDAVGYIKEVILPVVADGLEEFTSNPAGATGGLVCNLAFEYFTGGAAGKLGKLLADVPAIKRATDRFLSAIGKDKKSDFDLDSPVDELDVPLCVPGAATVGGKPCRTNNENDNDSNGCDLVNPGPHCGCNSFPTGTLIRMANGQLLPIDQVQPGAQVLAADPATGEWTHETVLYGWSHDGPAQLTTVALVDGSMITATAHHRFWVASEAAWTPLANVEPGDLLLTPYGTTETTGVHHQKDLSMVRVWDLDTSGPDTFTVHTGTTDLLVHNCTYYLKKNLGDNPHPPEARAQAHHLAPQGNTAITDKLDDFGIDVHSADNGVYLPSRRYDGYEGSLHRGRHTSDYDTHILDGLNSAETREDAIEFLNEVREDLENGDLTLNAAE